MSYKMTGSDVWHLKEMVSTHLQRWDLGNKYDDFEMRKRAIDDLQSTLAGPQEKIRYLPPKTIDKIHKIRFLHDNPTAYELAKSKGKI